MEGKRGTDLQTLTEIADNDVLIVDTAGGTRAITYAQLCAAVKDTLGIREVVESTNITEPGFLMDGKTASEAFAELYSNMATHLSISDATTSGDPVQALKNKWNTLPNKSFLLDIYCGSINVAIVQKIENGNYGSAIIFGYAFNAMHVIKNRDNWTTKGLSN